MTTALALRFRIAVAVEAARVARGRIQRADIASNDIQNELDATLARLDDLAYLDAAPLVHTALIEYRAGKITLQTLLTRVQDAYDDYGDDWTDGATTIAKQRDLLNNIGTTAGTVGSAAVAGHSLDMVTRTEQDDLISRSHAYIIDRASTLASQEFDTDRLTALEMLATQRLDDDAESIFDAYGRGDISFAQARQQYTTAAQADTWYSYQDMRNQYAIQDEDSTHAWWETDSPKTGSCDDCAVREEESPYLIEELPGLPCDNSTQCGPGCLCTVRYGSLVERRFFQRRTATIVRYSEDQARDEHGRWTDGGESGSTGTIQPTKERAWEGKAVNIENPPTWQETGRVGEQIALEHLRQTMPDVAPYNEKTAIHNNEAVDIFGDHSAIEVKAALASNPAAKWEAKIGQPGKAETAALKEMTADEKRAHNDAKRQAITDRKNAVIAKLSEQRGYEIKPKMVTLIIDSERRIADVYEFDGFHRNIGWRSDAAKAAYVRSYKY